ncbi:cation-translocating P-type ATPase [Ureaplasma urealyticum]|uniref:Cation-translocating P-type ATPase n=2 Tax=Ureaplasma urealyticum TaxID=2130 RepID=A0AAP9AD08_UREUR|nr:cation-translocating P-type ATPase [Ureaplasma urealyticum]EDT49720.1 cation-transporting ATPase family protein [Ureaplasma urealyticum serovar 13 str. ATCC 33698]EDU06071.1 cation-transporting ATPase family protein [Ureaplasma urealyticum serovar 5 str. ATCC 27817]EDU56949.1 cation-transporting ATPase family protein [Ureaplasma urealyticum serovar 7 str. ATCC 27819]EDU66816.1 cation-transporting ATPase family protein [Ureaplasma urealyticum serovar 11 str. ATCC 33695]EEH01590.1 cation-tran
MKKNNEDQTDSFVSFDPQNTDPLTGLNDEQVLKSRQIYGFNEIKKKKKSNILTKFFKQFLDFMVILLVIAGIITLILAIVKPPHDITELIVQYVEVGVIGFILFLNAIFGTIQEVKAEKNTEALSKLTSPQAKVLRNNQILIIDSREVVIGDILILEAGDWIPADALLINSSSLEVDEAVLTGESLPVQKDAKAIVKQGAGIGDRLNQIFSGTSITNGTAKAIVTNIGMNTEIGKIAKLINDQKVQLTPLQQKINKLSKIIGAFASVLCIAVFIIYIYLVGGGNWEINWHPALVMAISLSIAAIPEGIVAIVTIILSFGVKQMAKQNALIKRLPAVETLGSANVICSDKTGTLTQNKMTVTKVFTNILKTTDLINEKDVYELIKWASIANNGSRNFNDKKQEYEFIGDPTETSIIEAALKLNIDKSELDKEFVRIHEFPFDSTRKLMSVIVRNNDNYYLVTKGAIDAIEKIVVEPITNDVYKANDFLGKQALRVLGVGIKKLAFLPTNFNQDELERELEFIGLVGMIDPPRPEAQEAVEIAIKAGIRPVMITGDHINTASAIAKQIGILNEGQEVLSGHELSSMSDEELINNVERYSVYARVSPTDKIRIVKAWQSHDKVVSMTGDGVNDAPALKAADIGCAMGITGTDVSKASSDMILTDDNFATIINAVSLGRSIMDNIKRIIVLLLITNLAGLISLIFGIIILGINPMSSLQILWINVIAETLPGIALGVHLADANLMRHKPLKKSAPIVNKKMWMTIFINGFFIGLISILLFYLGASSHFDFDFIAMRNEFKELANLEAIYQNVWNWLGENHEITNIVHEKIIAIKTPIMAGSSLTFIFMGMSLAFNALSLRSNHSIFINFWKNSKYIVYSIIISVIMIIVITYTPHLNEVFNMNPYNMNGYEWFNVFPFVLFTIPLGIFEVIKYVKYLKLRRSFDYKNKTYASLNQEIKSLNLKINNTKINYEKEYYKALLNNLIVKRKILINKCHKEI